MNRLEAFFGNVDGYYDEYRNIDNILSNSIEDMEDRSYENNINDIFDFLNYCYDYFEKDIDI